MLYKNPTSKDVVVEGMGLTVPAGGTCDIPEAYGKSRKSPNGGRIRPIIEDLAPQLAPLDKEEADAFIGEVYVPKMKKLEAKDFEAQGKSPGAAAVMAEMAQADAKPEVVKPAPKAKK